MRKTLALGSLTLIAGLGFLQAPRAQAAVLSYEETTAGITGNGTGTVYSQVPVSDTFASTVASGTGTLGAPSDPGFSFYDDYIFTVPSSTVDVTTVVLNSGATFNISDLQLRLYTLAGNGNSPVLGDSPAGLVEGWSSNSLAQTDLSAGTYVLQLRGDVTGTASSSYAGVIDLQPVPLPAALPLLLSGIGLLGGLARKRFG